MALPIVRSRPALSAQVAAVALLAGGVGVGVASFLPAYLGGISLASQPDQAMGHAVPLAGFALATVLAVLARPPAGSGRPALGLPGVLGLGVAAVDLGLIVTDLGQAAAGTTAGDGLVLTMLSWALCAAGSLLALHPSLLRGERRAARRPGRADVVGALLVAVVGFAVAGLFAPAWDRYVVDLQALHRVTVVTAGDAFSQPGAMIAGSVMVMVAVAAVAVVGGLLRQAKVAATLLAGATIVLAGQIASALVQWRIPLPPATFGLDPARAAALGLHVQAGFTVSFYLFCVFVALLGLLALARVAGGERSRELPVTDVPVGWPGSPNAPVWSSAPSGGPAPVTWPASPAASPPPAPTPPWPAPTSDPVAAPGTIWPDRAPAPAANPPAPAESAAPAPPLAAPAPPTSAEPPATDPPADGQAGGAVLGPVPGEAGTAAAGGMASSERPVVPDEQRPPTRRRFTPHY